MIDFERACCPFHPQVPADKQFDRPDWWLGLPGEFAWMRCRECGLYFLDPRPTIESIQHYYPAAYAAYRPAIDDERLFFMRWKRRRNLKGAIEAVTTRCAPGALLDVGCATGNYLVEMRKRGWHVAGVEIQTDAAAYARERFGLDVFSGDLLQSNLPAQQFDVITMWDVLEHTHRPVAILQEAKRLLKPGGLLIFSIPDLDSKEAASFGPAWIGFDAPRHLHLFHNQSLRLLLAAAGFEYVAGEHFLATYHTWLASWQTQLNRRQRRGRLYRLLRRAARLPIWSILSAPYFNWLNSRGQGTVLTVFARAQ